MRNPASSDASIGAFDPCGSSALRTGIKNRLMYCGRPEEKCEKGEKKDGI